MVFTMGCKTAVKGINRLYFLLMLPVLYGLFIPAAFSKQPAASAPKKLTLSQAVMCEGIEEFAPLNEAVVFSIALKKVYCLTFFEPVPKKTWIFHNWYFRDRLIARAKLIIKPRSWKTYSSIQLANPIKAPGGLKLPIPMDVPLRFCDSALRTDP